MARKVKKQSAGTADRHKSTREKLLKAARTELTKGNGDLELARVAKRASVSDGLTYYHFGNKIGLIHALVNDFHQQIDEQIAGFSFEGETWAEREMLRVYAMVEFFYRDPVALLVATRLRTEPSIAADEIQRTNRLNELGARNIAQAQKAGEISATYNPLLLVSMILAGVTEGVRMALGTDPITPLEEAQGEVWAFVARAAGVEV